MMMAGGLPVSLEAAAESGTIWGGVYTAAQAARGQEVYSQQCSRCHREDLTGAGGVLIGNHFMDQWREDSLNSFYKILRQTMPANAPASLSEKQYLDIVAYVLQMNEFPAGEKELTPDVVARVRIEGKEGPAPVPDFSLVEVVGCLAQKPDGSWIVTNATEPVRTRVPGVSTPEELQVLKDRPLGSHTFTLLDFAGVQEHPVKGWKVDAKGFLIRKPGDDRINPSALQMVTPTCAGK
jgi:mono/diheme cytochrome c family protein